jgi:phosphate uptake regulator
MPEVRQRFSKELRALDDEVQQTATQAQLLLEQALRALVGGDLATCDQVVSGDDEAEGLPQIPEVLQDLGQMGKIALRMIGAAMDALARRDVDLAGKLPELDDPIDQLNREMLPKVLEASHDKRLLEWGVRMYVVSRQIERIGDNAVDVGEQVAFLVTGEFREFTDASHPEIEHPELLES